MVKCRKAHNRISDKLEMKIVEWYNKGFNTVQIAELSGMANNTSVRRVLIRNGVQLRSVEESQNYVTNNVLENQHYWLGVLATDGNIYKNRVKLSVQQSDKNWLELYAKLCGLNILNDPKGMLHVSFKNRRVKDYLVSLGITPAKSKTLYYKGNINWDFVRGVIDGDGTITKATPINIRIFSASYSFLEQLRSFFTSEGIETTINFNRNRVHQLAIYRIKSVIEVYTKLYYHKEVPCLGRKRDKLGSLIQEWNEKKAAKSVKVPQQRRAICG